MYMQNVLRDMQFDLRVYFTICPCTISQTDRMDMTSRPAINNRKLRATKVFERKHPERAIDT